MKKYRNTNTKIIYTNKYKGKGLDPVGNQAVSEAML